MLNLNISIAAGIGLIIIDSFINSNRSEKHQYQLIGHLWEKLHAVIRVGFGAQSIKAMCMHM